MSIPEGDMGKRLVCPNCKSPFLAGKSVSEPVTTAAPPPAPANPSYAKTMIGEMAPPIKYNCPRCKAPLEAPATEAGMKKPCPACGQRLQVPTPPPPAPEMVQPNLNKTMMAGDESRMAPPQPPIKYNCPNCKKPLESPASEGSKKKNCPSCGQRLQIPAAPNLNKTILASDESKTAVAAGYPVPAPGFAPGVPGAPAAPLPSHTAFTPRNLAIGGFVLLLLLIAVPAFIRGGKVEDRDALAKAQQEVEKLKAEIELRKLELEKQKNNENETRKLIQDLASKIREQDQRALNEEQKRKWDQEKKELVEKQQKLLQDQKDREDRIQREIDALRNKQQTIIQQPAPVIYYPPYHPRYYWPFGW
jgi:DNA-directed RNA polymerase subunit RPC12/RpoP